MERKVFVVSISKHSESSYDAEENRKVPRMMNGILRIFESKDDTKRYIETFYKDCATDNAVLHSHDSKKGDFKATLCDWYKEDGDAVTWDGIPLKDCKTKVNIKVYPMIITPSGSNTDLDSDMYDLLAGEETERAFIS